MITISRKLRPFSHLSGVKCLLPGTNLIVETSPHLLRIGTFEIPIDCRDFTLQQDLEKNCVWVFNKSFRIKIAAGLNGFTVGDQFYPIDTKLHIPEQIETLSLGSHKSQDWDLVLRRMDVAEILPVLYNLGQKTPVLESPAYQDYSSSFHSMAVPKDVCLKKTFEKIRNQFFCVNDHQITFLSDHSFPHGRLLNLQTEFGSFDMEWTKHKLRRVNFLPIKTAVIYLNGIKKFRMKINQHAKGVFTDVLKVEAGRRVYLDRFEVI